MAIPIARRHFTVADYYRMVEAGILAEDDRVELIEGEVVNMSPIGQRHASCVLRLTTLASDQVRGSALVSVQNPIRLDDASEPQPDLVLLRPRADFYAGGHPTPADVLLVVEVADTTMAYDRTVKVPLYARAGIPAVWLVNLPEGTIEVYITPVAGAYQTMRRARRGESLTLASLPALALSVDAILG